MALLLQYWACLLFLEKIAPYQTLHIPYFVFLFHSGVTHISYGKFPKQPHLHYSGVEH